MAGSPLTLHLLNPTSIAVAAQQALIRSGTGQLYRPIVGRPGSMSAVPNDTPIGLGGSVAPGETPLPEQFAITPGDYAIEISSGKTRINERLQIIYRNAAWIQLVEVYVNGKLAFATPKPPNQPNITLTFINTARLAIMLDNISDTLLREPHYQVALWSLSNRDAPPVVWSHTIKDGWIRPHEHLGPIQLADDRIDNLAKFGDELYGYAMVTCPECTSTKAFTVGLQIGGKGWYQETEPGFYPVPGGTEQFVKNFPWKSVNEIPLIRSTQPPRMQISDRPPL